MSINDEKPNNEQLTVSKHETEIDRTSQQEEQELQTKRERILEKVKIYYNKTAQNHVYKVEHRNILIVGRTRSGKSTIKKMLVDPTEPPDEMSVYAGTREPTFECFSAKGVNLVFNIIDTPGLFEHMKNRDEIRENEAILETIVRCANFEITKFHLICFAISITSGIQEDDIKALQLFKDRLGPELANYACLIITHCEMKNEKQRKALSDQLVEDPYFKPLVGYFKKGILFSGCMNYDDYERRNASIVNQFKTVMHYREQLLELFRKETKPLEISKSCISDLMAANVKHDELIKDINTQIETMMAQNQENDIKYQERSNELQKKLLKAKEDKKNAQITATKSECTIS